jgi:hypothetical protein
MVFGYDVDQETAKQKDLQRTYERVRGHEFRVGIEGQPLILFEQKEIDQEMHNKEAAEEEPCEADKELASDGGIIERSYPVHWTCSQE